MNNFTKEELEEVACRMENEPEWLNHKIKSMIDNYCEHDYIGSIKSCIDCRVSECRCNKCGCVSYVGLE